MSNKGNQEVRVEDCSTSSPLRTQDTRSDLETTRKHDAIINLFMSVTNSDTSENHLSVTVRASKRKSRNSHNNSKNCKHGDKGPHLSSGDSLSLTDPEESNGNTNQEDMDTEESILNIPLAQLLKEEECELTEIAEAWITTYQSSRYEALRSMLELILHTSGVLQPITKSQALKLDQLKPGIYDNWLNDIEAQPLLVEDLFMTNCFNFLKLTLAGDGCLYDILIMKRIEALLEVMTRSSWVSSRYTAVLIASLITFQYTVYISQLDSVLHDPLTTENEEDARKNIDIAKNLFDGYVKIVVQCQRDAALPVRKFATQIYCSWCVKRIDLLMTEKLLRQIFWAMYDDSSSIRRLAVKTCGSLYKNDYVVKNFKKFVEKSLSGMVNLILDSSGRVAADALDILIAVHRRAHWLLKDIDMEKIFILVYGDGWRAAKASQFLHEMLENMSKNTTRFILNTVLFLEESMVQLGESVNVESAITVMVGNQFPHSHRELTDWPAWRHLLVGNSPVKSERLRQLAGCLLVEIINYISVRAENHYFLETDFPSAPKSNNTIRKGNCVVVDEQKTEYSNYLAKFISKLGPHLIMLWEKFKNNPCMTRLLEIPQYFNGSIDSLDMKEIFCYLIYLSKISTSSPRMEAVHCSLACLYHFALTSSRWKHAIPNLERILFKDTTLRFMDACGRLGRKPIRPQVEMGCIKVIKQAFYLSKFFDITKTCLLDDAMYALRFGVEKRIGEIICPTLMICLYILEWQLKNVIDDDLPRDEKNSRLHKILSQLHTLNLQLEYLLKVPNSLIRETSFSVQCRLMVTFSPCNVYCSSLKLIHLPCLSLERSEWLLYNLLCQVPQDDIPQDCHKFDMAKKALKMYCSVLEVYAIDVHYFYIILIYFKLYDCPKNYNSVLESNFQVMARMEEFPYVLIEMLIWMKSNTDKEVEEIIKGICAVGLHKLNSAKLTQRIAREVIGFGLSHINNHRHHFIFKILTPFIKYLNKKDLEKFYSKVKDIFHLYLEQKDLKGFLATCVRNIELKHKQANQSNQRK